MPIPPTKPPPRKSSDSFPAVAPGQEERLWQALRRIETGLDDLNKARAKDLAHQSDQDQRLDAAELMLHELRKQTLEVQNAFLDVEKLTLKVDKLDTTVNKALEVVVQESRQSALLTVESARSERDQNLKILELEAQLRHTGSAAGKRAGLTWGGGAAVVGTILGALVQYLVQTSLPEKGPVLLPAPPPVAAPQR